MSSSYRDYAIKKTEIKFLTLTISFYTFALISNIVLLTFFATRSYEFVLLMPFIFCGLISLFQLSKTIGKKVVIIKRFNKNYKNVEQIIYFSWIRYRIGRNYFWRYFLVIYIFFFLLLNLFYLSNLGSISFSSHHFEIISIFGFVELIVFIFVRYLFDKLLDNAINKPLLIINVDETFKTELEIVKMQAHKDYWNMILIINCLIFIFPTILLFFKSTRKKILK